MSAKQFHSAKLNDINSLKKSNVSFSETNHQCPENHFCPVHGPDNKGIASGIYVENNSQVKPPSRNRSEAPSAKVKQENDGFKEVKTFYNPDGSQMRVTEELKNTEGDPFKVHLNTLIGKNQDYFDHLGGHCICGMCICGRCKCPKRNLATDYLKGNNSEYQTKYVPHKCLDNLPTLKADFFTSQYKKSPLDYSTTNRNDYKVPASTYDGIRGAPKGNKDYAPFLGSSSYKNDYLNWGANSSSNLKPGYQNTVIKELPFVGRTIYRDNYQGNQAGKDNDMAKLIGNSKYGVFRSPVSPDFPLMGETTYNNTYKPFKTAKTNDGLSNKKAYEQMPAYDGHFKSTHDKDFDNKGIRKCPAREVLNRLYQQGVIQWGR